MKQLGLALLQYTQDYDERFSPSENDEANYALSGLRIGPYTKSDQLLLCPSDSNVVYDVRKTSGVGTTTTSYYVSSDSAESPDIADTLTWGVFNNTSGISQSQVASPSETILMTERESGNNDGHVDRGTATATANTSPDSSDLVANRHLDTINYLFVDGHVKAMKRPNPKVANDRTGANATVNGVGYWYWWTSGVTGK